MYDKQEIAAIIVVICLVLIIMMVFIAMTKEKTNYELQEMIADKYFTFWSIYENSEYYKQMSYSEALYYFKKDNNMEQYYVAEGQRILIRVKAGE